MNRGRARAARTAVATGAIAAVAWGVAAGTGRRAGQESAQARAQALATRAADRLHTLQEEADQLASQEKTLLTELRRLEVERELHAEEARQADEQIRQASATLQATSDRITTLEARQAAIQPAVDARLVALYKLGRGGYARLLLSTPALRDFGRAYRMVAALSARDREQEAAVRETLAQLQTARATLEQTRTTLQAQQSAADRARKASAQAAADRSALVARIDDERDLNAQLTGELQVSQQKLQATLAALARGEAAAVPVLPLGPFRGALDWPANGPVTARFGTPPAGGAGFGRDGILIGAPDGAPVHAVHGGTVAFAGPFAGFGRLVILNHGGRDYTLYGDLASMAAGLAVGSRVDAGQLVGAVGPTPAGAPALYFELQIDGRAVDPLQWLKARH
ncbi:MAG TPA: peptidoglycan DD-metalloendopeptidase family protein [Vicinamibacterales bacterium]|jgi:septal ring factor EnvC (AmiA/AmiB activator)